MTPDENRSAPHHDDVPELPEHQPAFPPAADGDPAANPPVPLDGMPVPPLTEPTDVSGG
jgi:hypothetical protein